MQHREGDERHRGISPFHIREQHVALRGENREGRRPELDREEVSKKGSGLEVFSKYPRSLDENWSLEKLRYGASSFNSSSMMCSRGK